jgi:hypothetical protein
MKRLNKVRVALKHHGAHPDKATIDLLVEDTAVFFAANTPAVFGLDYTTISLAEVIADETVRQLVRDAETASADGDHIAAMIALADGLDELFDPPGRAAQTWGPSPLEFGSIPHARHPWLCAIPRRGRLLHTFRRRCRHSTNCRHRTAGSAILAVDRTAVPRREVGDHRSADDE